MNPVGGLQVQPYVTPAPSGIESQPVQAQVEHPRSTPSPAPGLRRAVQQMIDGALRAKVHAAEERIRSQVEKLEKELDNRFKELEHRVGEAEARLDLRLNRHNEFIGQFQGFVKEFKEMLR
jgi:hypothetical protein